MPEKKNLLLLVVMILLVQTTFAAYVNREKAENTARNFYIVQYNAYQGSLNDADAIITNYYRGGNESETYYHAFSFGQGYVIISAEDAYNPVIGYSFEGAFSEPSSNPNFDSFMHTYEYQIDFIRKNNIQAGNEIAEEWKLYQQPGLKDKQSRDASEPLLTCLWNQDDPYNAWCPEDEDGPGGRVYAGCVATAMSMIMQYWRYPLQGSGSHGYYMYPYGYLNADFGNTNYNWNAMLDEINNSSAEESINAIAQLQYHCGIAVDMGYSPDGSGAFSGDVEGAMRTYFNYDASVNYIKKSNYSTTDWIQILKGQIDEKQPIYYSGQDNSGGHAFVCDAYQDDYFHFNFGWSGSMNGFFTVSDVGGFNQGQAAVISIFPGSDYPYNWNDDFTLTAISGSIEDGSGPVENYLDNITSSWLIDPQTEYDTIASISLNFISFDTETDNDIVRIYDGATTEAPLLGEFSGIYTGNDLPAVSSTGNKMLITFTSNSANGAPGWKAEYDSEIGEFCQGMVTLTEPTGSITDGSGDKYYNNNSLCRWKIDPPAASHITINFINFSTEADEDILQIIDLSSSTTIGSFSGNELPPSVTSEGAILLSFITNSTVKGEGWELEYEIDNVGTEEMNVSEIQLYPNPARDHLMVNGLSEGKMVWNMTNIQGQIVKQGKRNATANNKSFSIITADLEEGIYLLFLEMNDQSIVRKVQITK